MGNPSAPAAQKATLQSIWEHYRAHAKTSRRLKAEQGQWRRLLLLGTIAAMLLTPFAKTFEKFDLNVVSNALTVTATVIFSLMAWLQREVLGDDSEQPWVRSRQTSEGLKALAFRFLGGVAPFDATGTDTALKQAEALVDRVGVAPDPVDPTEAAEKIPPVPLTVENYLKLRVDDQLKYYQGAIEVQRAALERIVLIGRAVSAGVVIFGALGAVIAEDWRDIWAPVLGAAATLAAAQNVRARRQFLIDSYSIAASKLTFAKARWEASDRSPAKSDQLIDGVESILAAENAGWVQQMLLKPVVPDPPASSAATNAAQ